MLEFPGSVDGPWARYIETQADGPHPGPLPEGEGETRNKSQIPNSKSQIGLVRYPRLVAKDAECAAQLKQRTLTNLYNQRPAWLDLAHRKLDAAVFAAYGWPLALSDDDLLARLLALNLARAAAE